MLQERKTELKKAEITAVSTVDNGNHVVQMGMNAEIEIIQR